MKRIIVGLGAALSLAACCVGRGTKVATPRGPRRVEDLSVDDELVVVDPTTHATSTSRVVAIRVSQRECGTLHHAGGALLVTTDHPIYDPDARGFFPAGDWLTGARAAVLVAGPRGVQREVLAGVEIFTRVEDVFDLTVAHEWHTFVADGVVVHNKEPRCSEPVNKVCACGNNTVGVAVCLSYWGSPQCTSCRPADSGVDDAGVDDAGVDDAGVDGGANDGG